MAAHDFTRWLSDALGGRPNTYLVERSGRKPNGRPRIDGSRVHAWLKGERPSFDLAAVAAEALGRPAGEALRAAGYQVQAPPPETPPAPRDRLGPDLADLLATDPTLTPSARAHLVVQYRMLQRLSALEPAIGAGGGTDPDEQAILDSELTPAQKEEALAELRERRQTHLVDQPIPQSGGTS